MPCISVALMAQYLNVRQHTIIIQTVHILHHDIEDTGSLPKRDFAWSTQMTSNKPSPTVVTVTSLYQSSS
jgi:hypothetical protein